MPSVGIVGGLGVGATIDYYERITAQCKARGVVPDLVFVHADVDKGQGFVRDGRLDALADYLLGFVERLARAGATAAALPAVTPHICIDRIVARSAVPMIDIVAPSCARAGCAAWRCSARPSPWKAACGASSPNTPPTSRS